MAAAVGMTPDALSRAIHGQRGFGAAELMRIADHFDADLHTLISGEPDPRRPRLVARHDYDQSTRTRSIPGHSADRPILMTSRSHTARRYSHRAKAGAHRPTSKPRERSSVPGLCGHSSNESRRGWVSRLYESVNCPPPTASLSTAGL